MITTFALKKPAVITLSLIACCAVGQEIVGATTTSSSLVPEARLSIVPKPVAMTVTSGEFEFNNNTTIRAEDGTRSEAMYLAGALSPAMGFALAVQEGKTSAANENAVILKLDDTATTLGEEGYRVSVKPEGILIAALRPAGIFYGCQTLRQMLPPEILGATKADGVAWKIPGAEIEDYPRFPWRGHLFDVCRHFFTVKEVKRSIDLMALHKLNRFHWHLTDDQGWRLEIKRYPKLTDVGAWRTEKDGKRYGGFYTQDEVSDIVAYAAERHVTVVPEIEMPGHANAALAAYPELGCTGGPYEVANHWGIFQDVYCAGQERTYQFNQNVLDEVMMLFPSAYIHIGGDECPKDRWTSCPKCQAWRKKEGLKDEHELQSYFVRRADKYLTAHGRRLIGWDEILEGGLAPGAILQSWRSEKGGVQAASSGHEVIMSPVTHCYLDYDYDKYPLQNAYSYEPIPAALPAKNAKFVLGLEGNMWCERVPNMTRYDFMVYPRMTALAEVGWSPKKLRSWADFEARMAVHHKRYDALGVKPGFPDKSPDKP
jgi:hexosaminidase